MSLPSCQSGHSQDHHPPARIDKRTNNISVKIYIEYRVVDNMAADKMHSSAGRGRAGQGSTGQGKAEREKGG